MAGQRRGPGLRRVAVDAAARGAAARGGAGTAVPVGVFAAHAAPYGPDRGRRRAAGMVAPARAAVACAWQRRARHVADDSGRDGPTRATHPARHLGVVFRVRRRRVRAAAVPDRRGHAQRVHHASPSSRCSRSGPRWSTCRPDGSKHWLLAAPAAAMVLAAASDTSLDAEEFFYTGVVLLCLHLASVRRHDALSDRARSWCCPPASASASRSPAGSACRSSNACRCDSATTRRPQRRQ